MLDYSHAGDYFVDLSAFTLEELKDFLKIVNINDPLGNEIEKWIEARESEDEARP